MIETDPVALRFVVIMLGFVVTIIGLAAGFRKVNATAQNAVENSQPVSNGFASNTQAELKEIKDLVVRFDQKSSDRFLRLEDKIDAHLQAHATQHVRQSDRSS